MSRQLLHITLVDLGVGGGRGSVPAADGWRFEVRDPAGPVYRAGSEKACKRWMKHRDTWAEKGFTFEYKSKYLDHVQGQLVFDEGGHSYGVKHGQV